MNVFCLVRGEGVRAALRDLTASRTVPSGGSHALASYRVPSGSSHALASGSVPSGGSHALW